MAKTEDMNITQLWAETLAQINGSLPEIDYNSWIRRISFGKEENGEVILYVPSLFVYDRVSVQYKDLIENTMNELGSAHYTVKFEIKKIDEMDSGTLNRSTPEKKQATEKETSDVSQKQADSIFNKDYTFDSFVAGDNSNFAYNACLAIAKNPGTTYNPCLLYGGVGLGKTHLIQSIGNYILSNNPKAKVLYVTAENFTNEFIQSYGASDKQKFKNKYRKASVLLVDDIHFLQGKEGTQEELFNTFNDLYDTGRQLVFTCDRPIEELKDISDRLKSRFTRGLNIDLLPPDYETRVAILQKKCDSMKFTVSNDVLSYIAENVSSNVRALESCLTRLYAYSQLLNMEITLEKAKEQLKSVVDSNKSDTMGITLDQVIRAVSSYFNISPFEIKGKGKKSSVVIPRQIAMYLCRNLTEFSTTEIGMEFGNKNHTTVMYNVQKIETKMRTGDNEISSVIDKLTSQIRSEARK